MITHVVTFVWKPGTTEDQVGQLHEALTAFQQVVPEIVTYRHGRDLGLGSDNADYAVVSTVDGADQLRAYLELPEHRRIVRELLAPILARRQAVQIHSPAKG